MDLIMISEADISREKKRTFFPDWAAASAIHMPREVLPTEGLAALILRWRLLTPLIILSREERPVVMPVILPLF